MVVALKGWFFGGLNMMTSHLSTSTNSTAISFAQLQRGRDKDGGNDMFIILVLLGFLVLLLNITNRLVDFLGKIKSRNKRSLIAGISFLLFLLRTCMDR
jgi:hypothetical protein